MCGIAGLVRLDRAPADAQPVEAMLTSIRHRGPNDSDVYTEGSVALGNVRLSVIDLSRAGHQPMTSNDGRFVLTYNGEIYNYRELRESLESSYTFRSQTDSEVLLAAYVTWGEDCLRRLNGMFAFAIYDRQQRRLVVVRDRFGIKPFYYLRTATHFVFASEPRAIAAVTGPLEPNDRIVHDYLVYGRTDHTADTFVSGIQSLPHGHLLEIQDDHVRVRRWYDLGTQDAKGFDSPEEYRDLLRSSVGLMTRSDVPLGVCLSGGLDSSTITSLLLAHSGVENLRTFSAAYRTGEEGDESYFREPYAGRAEMYETQPTAETFFKDLDQFVTAVDEPIPSCSPYAQFKVMELAGRHVTVLLDGQGADEQLAGYHYFFGYHFVALLRGLHLRTLFSEVGAYRREHASWYALKAAAFMLLPPQVQQGLRARRVDYVTTEFGRAWKGENTAVEALYGARSIREGILSHFEHKLEHLLKWEDRNSMWFSVESRVPFLDHRLVEKTLASATDQLISNGTTKQILRDAMVGILPERIRTRQDKVGFAAPESEWLSAPAFRTLVRDLLASAQAVERGYIDRDRALAVYDRLCDGQRDLATDVWRIVNLELWLRRLGAGRCQQGLAAVAPR